MQRKLAVGFGLFTLLTITVALPLNNEFIEKHESNSFIVANNRAELETSRKLVVGTSKKCLNESLLRNQDEQKIWDYLQRYGYVSSKSRCPNQRRLERAIKKFANRNGPKMKSKQLRKNIISLFERTLLRLSKRRRCGDPDVGKGEFHENNDSSNNQNTIGKRYTTHTPWGKTQLTYKFKNFDDNLSPAVQRQEIAKAFKMWTDVTPLSVSEVASTTTADITIEFASGAHSDSMPFDGPGLVVAHAFYPEQGQIHFDKDETFSTGGQANTVNLLSIAAHEIGHALGLGHSTDTGAIMHAQYQPYSPNLALSQDDIDGIKYIYPINTSGCTDEFWCADIFPEECPTYKDSCKKKCLVCT